MRFIKPLLSRLAIVIASIFITLLLLEILIRVVGQHDEDGQFYFLERRILPYRLQVHVYQENLERYLANTDESSLLYDANTGWILNPVRDDANELGMHAVQEYERAKPEELIRIALFGDSFTAGDEVAPNETWASVLEQCLINRGLNVEILNFGVSAYGMDQAYLRYLAVGQEFNPDIVVFGFQPGNLLRNITAFRPMIGGTLPLSKPHFIIENDSLRLLNQPAIPPEELISVYENFASHPLVQYESLYDFRYENTWWSGSKLLSLMAYFLWDGRLGEAAARYDPEDETVRLGFKIIDAFAEAVEANGSRFVIVNMAPRNDIDMIVNQQELPYAYMFDRYAERYLVLRPEFAFSSNEDSYYMEGGHYSLEANTIVANSLCDSFYEEIALVQR